MASCSSGRSPGVRVITRAPMPAGRAPRQIAATRPARTNDDLPLPEAPTTATKRASASRARTSATSASRPKKNAASSGWKARSPL